MNAAWIRADKSATSGVDQTLSVWQSEAVRVNFLFGWGAPFQFDFDLREMVYDEAIDSLVRLLRLMSSVISKDDVIRPRGGATPIRSCMSMLLPAS